MAALTRRSVPADDQETRSIGQFIDRVGELKWKPQGPRKDYGEDYLVQIWDDGVPSGLSFYVQIKSITNAEKRKGKRDPETLRYKLEVKDIDHWAAHAVPVVLVIWDVQARVGYWQTIRRMVEGLEKEKPRWRENVHVTVNVPVANTTNDEGMGKLRFELAEYVIPLFNAYGSKEMKISMSQKAFDALIAGWDRGQRVILRDDLLPTIEHPEWHRRLFQQRGRTTEVQFGALSPSAKTVVVRVEVRIGKATAAVPYVEFRQIGAGIRHLHFSNEHQQRPLIFSVEGERGASTLQFRIRRASLGRSIIEEREITEFEYLANQPGGHIRVVEMGSGQIVLEKPTQGRDSTTMTRLKEHRDIMEKLVEIEGYVSKFGVVDLSRGMSENDIQIIEILHKALTTGKVEIEESFSLEVMPEWPEFSASSDEPVRKDEIFTPTLFGLSLPIHVKDTIVDSSGFLTKLRVAHEQARTSQRPVVVHFESLRIVRELFDGRRLQDLATTQAGYFTLPQALEVGFASAEQLEIHERVARSGKGVYRFLLHPPSEREDLVIAWLQTEKQGVFSHDTALALHEFSDILPTRLHITVPAEWKPVEGMELAANVVVHYGAVASNEMDWMGPVPYTKPLRTLADCIEKGLASDLVQQGIDDARRRGKITLAEAERLRLLNLKSA